jgi:hypothetical protein
MCFCYSYANMLITFPIFNKILKPDTETSKRCAIGRSEYAMSSQDPLVIITYVNAKFQIIRKQILTPPILKIGPLSSFLN